jgi:hypothetical protein
MSESGRISVNGTEYVLTLNTDLSSRLAVTLVNALTFEQFSNTFSSSFIENMSKSTGNYKSFSIFCEMLIKCLQGNGSDCLSFDFKEINEKKYLILCYSIKFDRVFYPLPLKISSEIHYQLQLLILNNEKVTKDNTKLILNNEKLTKDNNDLKIKIECIKNGLLHGEPIPHLLVIYNFVFGRCIAIQYSILDCYTSPKYKIIKSEPIIPNKQTRNDKSPRRLPKHTHNTFQRHNSPSLDRDSRKRQQSPFKRFDPTAYIRTRELKLEKSIKS